MPGIHIQIQAMNPSETRTVTTHEPDRTPASSVIHGVVGVVNALRARVEAERVVADRPEEVVAEDVVGEDDADQEADRAYDDRAEHPAALTLHARLDLAADGDRERGADQRQERPVRRLQRLRRG